MRLVLVLLLAVVAAGCGSASSLQAPTLTPPSTSTPASTAAPAPAAAATATPAPQASQAAGLANEFAYVRTDGTLWLVNADGATQRVLVSGLSDAYGVTPLSTVSGAAWSPDGKYITYSTPQGALLLLDVDSGETTTLDDSNKSPTPTLEQDSLNCSFSNVNEAFLCWGPPAEPAEPPASGGELDLKWPGKDLQVVSENACAAMATWSPDGGWLAYFDNCRGGSTETGEVHALNPETGKNIELGTFNSDEGAQWAPSTDRLIFDNLEIDPSSGEVKQLFERPFTGVTWSPDFTKVEFIDAQGTLLVLDLASGKRTELQTLSGFDAHRRLFGLISPDPIWSPDGHYLAFSGFADSSPGDSTLYTLDAVTGDVKSDLTTSSASETDVFFSPDRSHLLVSQRNGEQQTISITDADGSSLTSIGEGLLLRQPWRPLGGAQQ